MSDPSQYRGQPHAPAVATASAPTYTEGAQVNLSTDLAGNQRVTVGGGNLSGKTILSVTGSANSNAQIVAAVASKRIKVVAVEFYTLYSAGAIVPILTDGNGGATLWSRPLQAISGTISGAVAAIGGLSWLFGTSAGNALYLNPNGQTVYYNISYFTDDAS